MKWSFESADAGSAYVARNDMLAYLVSRCCSNSDIDGAALIFGELVGNVVRHAPGAIAIELVWDGGAAVLQVTDYGPGFDWNGSAQLPEALAESGRGLFIAHSVATKLVVAKMPRGGTRVTAWLPVQLRDEFKGVS